MRSKRLTLPGASHSGKRLAPRVFHTCGSACPFRAHCGHSSQDQVVSSHCCSVVPTFSRSTLQAPTSRNKLGNQSYRIAKQSLMINYRDYSLHDLVDAFLLLLPAQFRRAHMHQLACSHSLRIRQTQPVCTQKACGINTAC